MRIWALAAIGIIVFLAAFASRANAQDAVDRLIDRPIAAVQFEVEGRAVTLPALNTLAQIKPGDPFRLEMVREAEARLIAGGYDDVQVAATEASGGLVLLFKLTPKHPIESIQFKGEPGLSDAELGRLLRERYGGQPTREQPELVASTLEQLLQDEGFATARVQPEVVMEHDPDRATLVLNVTAGTRSTIGRADVEGESPLSKAKILERLGAVPGAAFRRADLEVKLAEIEDQLRKDGYYGAVAVLGNEPSASDAGVNLRVVVNAGPKVDVKWDGFSPSRKEEQELVPLARLRSVDEDLLEDSDARVIVHLQRLGYRDVKVTHTPDQQGNQLVITMHVDRGVQYLISSIDITGNAHMTDAAAQETLGVQAGKPYDPAAIASGIARLRGSYQRTGYYKATVTELDPEEVPGSRSATQVRVNLHIDVAEGPQARIGRIDFTGVRADFEPELRGLMASKPSGPFVDPIVKQIDLPEIQAFYENRGFENVDVKVDILADPASAGDVVNMVFLVNEGPQVFVGDITFSGNVRVSQKSMREQMTLQEGQPFGVAARLESQRQLYQMGVFERVTVEEQLRTGGETVAHVVVTVVELAPNTFDWGGGLEGGRQALITQEGATTDRIFFAPRGFLEIGRRNLWGKNRSIDFLSRVAPRPTTTVNKNFGFLEYRVSTQYREPHAFNSDTDLTLGVASEQVARTGFNYARRTATLQLVRRVSRRVTAVERIDLDHTRLFDVDPAFTEDPEDQVALARLFTVGRLVPISSSIVWDRRDEPISPTHGSLSSANFEFTARKLGSEVGFAKAFMQVSGFRAASASKRTILAGRAELGMARGFARVAVDPLGNPLFDEQGNVVTVSDLPVNQRFFAGGSTTVRGFQLDRLGYGKVLAEDGLSRGGNGLVIFNGEVRTRIVGNSLGAAFFADVGNVFERVSDIDVSKLRMTIGVGARYNSPLGPIRFDVGFKTDRQVVAGRRERGWEYHLNIGEAF